MKAVNLLPERNRPRKPTSGQSKSGYAALGVLGALLIAVLVYVLTLNSINTSKTEAAQATADAQRLDDQANSLGPYGDFAQIKAERVASVKQLAEGRFDWERLVRELAHVLPSHVWLVTATASATGTGDTGATGATGATPDPNAAPAGPTLTIEGCARDQSQVAVTLVRLRELQGATDVSLSHSTRGEGASAAPASSQQGQSGDSADTSCGSTGVQPNYSFQADVTFAQVSDGGKVPDRLGGGS